MLFNLPQQVKKIEDIRQTWLQEIDEEELN
jgi:hypothetical protein